MENLSIIFVNYFFLPIYKKPKMAGPITIAPATEITKTKAKRGIMKKSMLKPRAAHILKNVITQAIIIERINCQGEN